VETEQQVEEETEALLAGLAIDAWKECRTEVQACARCSAGASLHALRHGHQPGLGSARLVGEQQLVGETALDAPDGEGIAAARCKFRGLPVRRGSTGQPGEQKTLHLEQPGRVEGFDELRLRDGGTDVNAITIGERACRALGVQQGGRWWVACGDGRHGCGAANDKNLAAGAPIAGLATLVRDCKDLRTAALIFLVHQ
jgi:hypothetical protein